MLSFEDKWVWDFWFALDEPDIHIFYLQANKSLGDPSLRHWNVSIGHAVSQNWREWTILPDAFGPSGLAGSTEDEPFDSMTTWTGSVIQRHGLWYMFYTGGKQSENGLVQRIGVATSDDLIHWSKHKNDILIEPNREWYETFDPDLWHDQAWRDPWVFYDADSRLFHMFITARANYGPKFQRGVIGHAKSKNLVHWEICPPTTKPRDVGVLELPQLISIGNQHYLIFSCYAETASQSFIQRTGGKRQTGVHYFVSDDPFSNYQPLTDSYFAGGFDSSLYSGKIITDVNGELALMAFNNSDQHGNFVGTIGDPIPLYMKKDKQPTLAP